ncbi:phosphoglycerate dehydrogenase [Sporomusa aerivorans]|uniref:phosphoglycerate dehydrogenase n=1 Tax=Sporomusa aerivorans TaxID=204936 RepID=UPI00352B9202
MTKRVLVTAMSFRRSAEGLALLKDNGFDVVLSPYERPLQEAEMLEQLDGIAAIVAGNDAITEKVIAAGAPELKIIARSGVGYNTIDVAAAQRYGVAVTNTPGANTRSVAELAVGLMLSLARNIPRLNERMHNREWPKSVGTELGGKTLGIVGTGNIGREVIRRAAAFEMNIIAFDMHRCGDLVDKYGEIYRSLDEVFAESDFLSLHVPAIPGTVNMVNKTTLKIMKRSAYLINTARGELVVEKDLAEALQAGVISGAALDTFAAEPLQHDSSLFALNNVILTPHLGASTGDSAQRVGLMAAEEVIRVLSGIAPYFPVKPPLL